MDSKDLWQEVIFVLDFNNGIVIEWVSGSFKSRPVNPTYPISLTVLYYSSMGIIRGLVEAEHDATGFYPMGVTNNGTLTPKNSGEYMVMILGY